MVAKVRLGWEACAPLNLERLSAEAPLSSAMKSEKSGKYHLSKVQLRVRRIIISESFLFREIYVGNIIELTRLEREILRIDMY